MNYSLEIRSCMCGCGHTFKVLPSSSMKYSSITHDASNALFVVPFNDFGNRPLVSVMDEKLEIQIED